MEPPPRTSDPLLVRVALTGGIATGKSYCLRRLADLGASVIDADQLARRAIAPGSPGFDAVVRRFGRQMVDRGGAIDRSALGRLVFRDAAARIDLEAIVHPAVYEGIAAWLSTESQRGVPDGTRRVAVADVPLLYETGHAGDFDRVIVAACEPEQQIARIVARDGLSADAARQRLAAQLPIADKRQRADYVVDTGRSFEATNRQIEQIWRKLSDPTQG